MGVENPVEVFYHDVPSEKASQAVDALKPHSKAALFAPSPPSAWGDEVYHSRRGYIRALEDRAIPLVAQEMMVNLSGVEWKVREMNTSHSPFLSKPRETAGTILEMIAEFQAE